jgi:hypothetical protein
MTSCAMIKEATSAAPKATAICERAIHAGRCLRRECAATNNSASGRQQVWAICSRSVCSLAKDACEGDGIPRRQPQNDEVVSGRRHVVGYWPLQVQRRMTSCEWTGPLGWWGRRGAVHDLIFQPKYWKLVVTSVDPNDSYRLEQDTMPLIHESYDSLPCTFNLHHRGLAMQPTRPQGGFARVLSAGYLELTRCRCRRAPRRRESGRCESCHKCRN